MSRNAALAVDHRHHECVDLRRRRLHRGMHRATAPLWFACTSHSGSAVWRGGIATRLTLFEVIVRTCSLRPWRLAGEHMYGIVASTTTGGAKPASHHQRDCLFDAETLRRVGVRERNEPKITQRPSGRSSRLIRCARTRRSFVDDVDEPRRDDRVESVALRTARASRPRARSGIRPTPAPAPRARARTATSSRRRGASGNSCRSSRAPWTICWAASDEQRIDVECDRDRRLQSRVNVVCEPAARPRRARECATPARSPRRARDEVERRLVFLVAPAPVAVQVRVVGRQALRRRQPRAQRQVRLECGRDVAELQRRQQAREIRRDARFARCASCSSRRRVSGCRLLRFERARAFARRPLPTAAAAGACARATRRARPPAPQTRHGTPSRSGKSTRQCSQRKRCRRRAAFAQRGHASRSTNGGALDEVIRQSWSVSMDAMLQMLSAATTSAVRPAPPSEVDFAIPSS